MFKYFKILFFITITYLPFQIALNPLSGVDLASGRVLIAILILYWLYNFYFQPEKKIVLNLQKLDLIGIFLVLFLFWSVFSLFWADNFSFAFRKVIFWLNIFPFYFVAQMFLKTKKDLIVLFKILIYSSAFVAFIAILQFGLQFIYSPYLVFNKWFLLYPFLFGKTSAISAMLLAPNWLAHINSSVFMRSIGSFPDPNTFGFYLAFVIPLALLVKEKYFKIIGGMLILALLFTFSRGAYIGAIISLIILLFLNLKFKIKNEKLRIKFFKFKVPIILFFVFCSFLLIISPIGTRFFSSFDFQDKGVSERLEIWSQAVNVIKKNPVLGVGIGNYVERVDLFSEQRGYRSPIHAHNIYLQITAELGIIGLILYLTIFIFALKKLYCLFFILKEKTILKYKKGWFFAVFLSLIWFSAHGFFDIPIFSPRILPLLMVFLALTKYNKNNE